MWPYGTLGQRPRRHDVFYSQRDANSTDDSARTSSLADIEVEDLLCAFDDGDDGDHPTAFMEQGSAITGTCPSDVLDPESNLYSHY